jgi:hypothetical protein
MYTARRHIQIDDDDMGNAFEDFEATGHMASEKRRVGDEADEWSEGEGETNDPTKAYLRRMVKIEAARVLRKAKWSQERIAVAIGWSSRHIRRKVGECRRQARLAGRV